MKVLVVLFIFCVSVFTTEAEDDGQYHPDDEGKYIPDNSGRYIPDNSGLYHDDGTGRFINDVKGQYRNSIDRSEYQNNYDRRYTGSASSIRNDFIKPNIRSVPIQKSREYDDGRWKIIRLASDLNKDGFHWEYETENEIIGKEDAKVHNRGTKEEIIRTQGFYKYTGPDNTIYNVEYTADENGFIPRGNHLPQSLQRAISLNLKSQTL